MLSPILSAESTPARLLSSSLYEYSNSAPCNKLKPPTDNSPKPLPSKGTTNSTNVSVVEKAPDISAEYPLL